MASKLISCVILLLHLCYNSLKGCNTDSDIYVTVLINFTSYVIAGLPYPLCCATTLNDSISCTSLALDASPVVSSSGKSMAPDIDDEESSRSDFEEDYSWPAFGGRDVHSLLYKTQM